MDANVMDWRGDRDGPVVLERVVATIHSQADAMRVYALCSQWAADSRSDLKLDHSIQLVCYLQHDQHSSLFATSHGSTQMARSKASMPPSDLKASIISRQAIAIDAWRCLSQARIKRSLLTVT
jgi:hypothetical protein